MFETRALFENDPETAEAWLGSLEATHQRLVDEADADGPLWHTTQVEAWQITLHTSSEGELSAATSTRARQEYYRFLGTEEGWQACGRPQSYEDVFFKTLIGMAVRAGLEWSSGPLIP